MCRIYGKAFTHLRWVDSKTVSYYQSCPLSHAENIDMQRAKSEIAFYNPTTQKTKYGIDAFIEILWQGKLTRILRWKPLYWTARKIYRFISFNRKVIAPARGLQDGEACNPPLHKGYRFLYLIFSIAICGLGLQLLLSSIPYFSDYLGWKSLTILSGLPFIVQYLVLAFSKSNNKLDHLGNMATVSNIGVLLFLPALFIYQILNLPLVYLIIALSLIVVIAFKEISERTALLQQNSVLVLSWALGYLFTLVTPFLS